MGVMAFPATLYARISPQAYEAEKVPSVSISTAGDGAAEFRLYNGEAWRCRFTLITRSASERATLREFYDARHGGWDSFLFIAPDDGAQRRVRFDEFTGAKTGPLTWEYQITLRETST